MRLFSLKPTVQKTAQAPDKEWEFMVSLARQSGLTVQLGFAVLAAGAFTPAAHAQSFEFGVEATTDEVRRGLSWSD